MKTRHWDRRGDGGVTFTELGFGSAPLGNIYQPITEAQAQATLDAAWETGVRYLDTAPLYGLGLAETRYLVLMDKVAPTPAKYPRRPGMPAKRPIR